MEPKKTEFPPFPEISPQEYLDGVTAMESPWEIYTTIKSFSLKTNIESTSFSPLLGEMYTKEEIEKLLYGDNPFVKPAPASSLKVKRRTINKSIATTETLPAASPSIYPYQELDDFLPEWAEEPPF